MSSVPPRVIPLFIQEIATSRQQLLLDNLRCFQRHMDEIFSTARVVDEDIADLVVALCSLGTAPWAFEAVEQTTSSVNSGFPAYAALQVLLALFDVTKPCSAQAVRVVKRLAEKIVRKMEEEKTAGAGKVSALQLGARGARGSIATKSESSMTARSATSAGVGDAAEATALEVSEIARANSALGAAPTGHEGDADDGAAHQHDQPVVTSADAPQARYALHLDPLLQHHITRSAAWFLLQQFDVAFIDVSIFTSAPEALHLYLPRRLTGSVKVYRDFALCTARPKLAKTWGPIANVHIKTNIPARSEVMYRILVEGYNYGVNAAIQSDVVGYANRNWDELGNMTKYGWPEGWDVAMCNNYAPGAVISQYFSADRFVVVKLSAKSMFSVGFGVSAWLCFHGMGNGFPITATIYHQDADL